jgi:DNA modification methylase
MVAVGALQPYARNARTHSKAQIAQIAASIREFGFTNPVLIDAERGIIAGHGRVLAAKQLGLAEVPCLLIDHLSEAQKRAYVLADNRLALSAGWDEQLLALELGELADAGFNVDLIGFTGDELGALLRLGDEDTGGLTDPDEVPEPVGPAVTRPGDLWLLGPHRLACGSSLDRATLELVTGGELAHMVWTDPPYLMDFRGAVAGDGSIRSGHAPIANDNLGRAEGDRFLQDFTGQVAAWCRGPWYITFHRLGIDRMFAALAASGLRWRNLVVWKKDHLNLSNSDYKALYEPMFVGWADDWEPVFYGWAAEHPWYGRKGETDVWEVAVPSLWQVPRTRKNDLHPTMKPVELITRALENSSRRGQTVLDLFSGSGSTIIAAQATRREARAVELEPAYVDVAVRRWEAFTGRSATLAASGQTFSEVAGERLGAGAPPTHAATGSG